VHCYTTNFFARKSGDDDVDSLKYFNALKSTTVFL
jgi:hypothetical protein